MNIFCSYFFVIEIANGGNVLKRRFKLRKGKFFGRNLGKLSSHEWHFKRHKKRSHMNHSNYRSRNDSNSNTVSKSASKSNSSNSSNNSSVASSDIEAYENYQQLYELSEIDKRRAELRLLMETRNDLLVRSILPNLDRNVKLQFKNYKNYKKTVIESIKDYETTLFDNMQNETIINNKNDNDASGIGNISNNMENTPMSMDSNTLPQSNEMNAIDSNRNNSNDLNATDSMVSIPSIATNNNEYDSKCEESLSLSPTSKMNIPAEKDIIPSNANTSHSNTLIPHNFNHFLQYVESLFEISFSISFLVFFYCCISFACFFSFEMDSNSDTNHTKTKLKHPNSNYYLFKKNSL